MPPHLWGDVPTHPGSPAGSFRYRIDFRMIWSVWCSLDGICLEGVVEIEAEQTRVLANDSRRHNRKNIVVCLLRDGVLAQQLPEIPLSRVFRHFVQHIANLV